MEKDVLILTACVRVRLPVESPFSRPGLMAWLYPIINAMTGLWPLPPRPANGEGNALNFFINLMRGGGGRRMSYLENEVCGPSP